MNLVAFSSTAFLTWTAVLALRVFVLGQFDNAYGSQGTFQAGLLFGVAATMLETSAFAVSTKLLGRHATPPRSFVSGFGCAVAFVLLACWTPPMTRSGTLPLYASASIAVLCGAIAGLVSARAAGVVSGGATRRSGR